MYWREKGNKEWAEIVIAKGSKRSSISRLNGSEEERSFEGGGRR